MESFKKFISAISGGDPGENYPPLLTFAYVFALSMIALFTFVSHTITSYISDTQLARAEVIYQLRSQSTLVLEISSYAGDYYKNSMQYDYIFLKESIEKLETSHRKTEAYLNGAHGFEIGGARDTLEKYYHADGFDISGKLEKYIKSSHDFTVFSNTSSSEQRQAVLKQLNGGADRLLIELLNAAQADFQKENIDETQSIMNIQLYMSVGIILVILMEAIFIFRPIIRKLDEYHTTIISQAHEDILTGLNNRRAFYKQADIFFDTVRREKKPFTVLLCDLDKFKSVNDTYGHEVGDEVLKHFAATLKTTLRPFDIVARLGGEEFAIILGNTTPKIAEQILDRLLNIVRANSCEYTLNDGTTGSLKYTTSVGYIVGDPLNILDLDSYLRCADIALYKAKEGGRDRHIRYEAEEKKQETESNISESAVYTAPETDALVKAI